MNLKVQERLAVGDFEGAKKLYRLMPKKDFTIAWDEASIPANLRPSFAAARDKVVQAWQHNFSGAKIEVVPYKKGMTPAPQLAISFVEGIPPREGDPFPPGAAMFFSEDPAEPRLEYVISRTRGNPPAATDYVDIHNEIAHALAQYSGIERSPIPGSFGFRTDQPTTRLNTPSNHDRLQVQAILDASSLLAKSLMKQEKIAVARPKLHFDPAEFELGTAMQGTVVRFKLQVSNLGTGPLVVRAMPDCTCVSAARVSPIEPGETRLIQGQVDLHDVIGFVDKNLILFSNDAEKTSTPIPVRIRSKPLYRFLPENDGNVLMNPGGAKTKIFMLIPDEAKLKPLQARFDGIEAKVTFRPWSGTLADPDLKEPAMPRKGFVFDVDISDRIASGRSTGTMWVQTDNADYREIYVNLFVQQGIVALPDQIRLGEIPMAPRRAAFLVSRPGKPFRITKVEADTPFLATTIQPVRENWEYRITVQFDGKAPPGILKATLSVHTDDPAQPVLTIPYHAIVQ